MIHFTHAHTHPTDYLQGVLAERRLEAEGGSGTFSSDQAITQDNLIKFCFWWRPLHKRYSVGHVPHNQLCGAINHCEGKQEEAN